jgi:hypothetical protein
MIPIRYPLAAVLAAAFAAAPGRAGVVLKGQGTNLKDNATFEISMLVDSSRLRMDTRGKDADSSIILRIQGDDYQMIMLDNRQKEYRVVDRKTMAEMGAKISGAMAQLEEQLKNMTPEQRAMMEKMMGKKLGEMMAGGAPAELPPLSYRAAGAGSVGGRPCKKYDVFRGEEKVSELCAARPETLELGPAEMAVFEKMKAIFDDMTKWLRRLPGMTRFQVDFAAKPVDGFPIQQVVFNEGQPVARIEFHEAARRSFSEADFSTGDARKLENPMGPPGR